MDTETELTGNELLSRVALGDEEALGELYTRLSPRVFALALRMLGSREEAEEVVQDTFIKLYQGAGRYQAELHSVTAFTVTVAQHLALSRLRARQARPAKADDYDVHDPASDFAQPGGADPTLRPLIAQALSVLGPDERRLLEESFFDGYSHDELAVRHNLPLGSLKSKVRRALLKLRRALETPHAS
ncbi:sigma-70 family RNA polymerase sigma factor [Deinococcus sp.]|uniref:RNA polymerase sigma factor n=1 Tax=Deinococcus sp. TaxID=47478 RepID=UPI0025E97BA6|nr:sigma-70 family RNA polymerase sigma factor [Deinococcus sp.]